MSHSREANFKHKVSYSYKKKNQDKTKATKPKSSKCGDKDVTQELLN